MLPLLIMLQLDTGEIQARKDSEFIFNAYNYEIQQFKTLTKPEDYYKVQDSIEAITACNKVRLSKYNKKDYLPIEELNKEGFGTAKRYPEPQEIKVFTRLKQPQELDTITYFDKRTGRKIK